MKRILITFLALLLCLSTVLALTSCNKDKDSKKDNDESAVEDKEENKNENKEENKEESTKAPEVKPTEKPTEQPTEEPTDNSISTLPENPEDFMEFLKVAIDGIKQLSASAELNIAAPTGTGTISAAMQNGNFYLGAEHENEKEEVFATIKDNAIEVFALNNGKWESVERVDLEEMITSMLPTETPDGSTDINNFYAQAEEILSKIVVPELSDKYLTKEAATGMEIISNDYIIEVVAQNFPVFYEGEQELTDEMMEELKTELKAMLDAMNLTVKFARNSDGVVTKMVCTMAPDAEIDESLKNVSVEMALTADGTMFDYALFEITQDIGIEEIENVTTSTIRVSSVIVDGEFAGVSINADLYSSDYQYPEEDPDFSVTVPMSDLDYSYFSAVPMSDLDYSVNIGSYSDAYSEILCINKLDIDVTLDFSKIASTNGVILDLGFDAKVEKAYNLVYAMDTNTFTTSLVVCEELTDLSSVSDENMSMSVKLAKEGSTKVTLNLAVEQYGETATVAGYVDFDSAASFPAIPDALKGKLN